MDVTAMGVLRAAEGAARIDIRSVDGAVEAVAQRMRALGELAADRKPVSCTSTTLPAWRCSWSVSCWCLR
ncbi:hypothetical protein I552_4002 [Mycobacterium xenopi 3993]|nr:hypothetical protein I552_4002 [Mycobacterium xenopi 3993]